MFYARNCQLSIRQKRLSDKYDACVFLFQSLIVQGTIIPINYSMINAVYESIQKYVLYYLILSNRILRFFTLKQSMCALIETKTSFFTDLKTASFLQNDLH